MANDSDNDNWTIDDRLKVKTKPYMTLWIK